MPTGLNHGRYKGQKLKSDGYILTSVDGRYVREHRLVMERVLGRKLEPVEDVHHIDRNKRNNHPSNLVVLTRSEHAQLHASEAAARWARFYDTCSSCGDNDKEHAARGLCTACYPLWYEQEKR